MAKVSLKKLFEKDAKKSKKKDKNQSKVDKKYIIIAFNILAFFCIVLYSISITPKSFQNDTFYTIKIGQLIRQNGIDYKDHFSWHFDLPYMYPHWLYDLITSLVFDYLGGIGGVYVMTVIFTCVLGIVVYQTNKKISKNYFVSFAMTIGQLFLLKDYIAARAQLVTFILFMLTIIFIEKFLEKPKIKYAIGLVLIPIAIANLHSAVFPFYFILYLPYIGEYVIRDVLDWHLPHKIYQNYLKLSVKYNNEKLKKADKTQAKYFQKKLANLNKQIEQSEKKFNKFVNKQKDRRKNPYRVKFERNDNVIKLFFIMIICLFTGLLTPLKDMPYTYTWKIMKGNTTASISEHLPLTLIENKGMLISISLFLVLSIFTKVKIRLRDLFFAGGLILLALMSRRQTSMLVLFGGLVLGKMIADLFEYYDKKGVEDILKFMTTIAGEIITILLIFSMCYCEYKPKINSAYINENSYPVQAAEWIKENLDYKNIKLFNDYNYGSYLLYEDIPVFIDSRCDLYTPEFNGTYDKNEKVFKGQDIFSDYINISSIATYYDSKFKEYDITHVMTKKNSKLSMLISRDSNYKEIYKDSNFVIYEVNK